MPESILNDVKKVLGLAEDYTAFDTDVLMHINSALSTLQQLGVGPEEGFEIGSTSATWDQLLSDEKKLNMVRSWMYLKVRMLFDPPVIGFVITAMEKQLEQLEWRIMVAQDQINDPDPIPTPVPVIYDPFGDDGV